MPEGGQIKILSDDDIECPICCDELSLNTVYVTSCECRFIMCYSCWTFCSNICPNQCGSIVVDSGMEDRIFDRLLKRLEDAKLEDEKQEDPQT